MERTIKGGQPPSEPRRPDFQRFVEQECDLDNIIGYDNPIYIRSTDAE